MKELEQANPNWRRQVESSNFRNHNEMGGYSFFVLTHPGIDVVVKIPKEPLLMQGYQIAEDKAPELAIPFSTIEDLRLKIDGRKIIIPKAVVQVKTSNFENDIYHALGSSNSDSIYKLLVDTANADKALLQKGVLVADPKLDNFALDKNGKVKCLDFSGVLTSLDNDLEYSHLVTIRGLAHYVNYLKLRFNIDPLSKGIGRPSAAYARAIGMPSQLHPKASDETEFEENSTKWDPELVLYFAQIGDEEFRRICGNPPFDIDTNYVVNMSTILGTVLT